MRRKPYLLLILLLLMCVGFAAVTTSLIVNGTASIGQSDFEVYFSEVTQNIFGEQYTGDVSISPDKKSITFNSDMLSSEGDMFAMGYTLTNGSSNYDANVTFKIKYISGEELKDNIDVYIYKVDNYSIRQMNSPTPFSNNDTYLLSAKANSKFAFGVRLNQPILEENKIELELTYDVTPVERTSYVDKSGEEEVETYFNLEPGLYTLDKEQTKTWQELIDEGIIHVEDGKLSTNYIEPVKGNDLGETEGEEFEIVEDDNSAFKELKYISDNNTSCSTLKGMLVVDEGVSSFEQYNLVCEGLKVIVLKNPMDDYRNISGVIPISVLYTKNDYITQNLSGSRYFEGISAINPIIDGEYAINPNNSSELYAYLGNDKDVVVPEKFTSIKGYPFYLTPASNVTIPDSVSSISNEALYGIYNAVYHGNATYDEDYKNWGAKYLNKRVDGDFVIGGLTGDVLLEYTGEDKNIVIPEGVRVIGDYCFESKELESVKLPSTLEEIGYEAFQYTGLTFLEVPSSVTKIANDAFYDIKTVIYDGPAICDPDYSDNWGAEELYGSKDDEFVYTNGGKTIIKYLGTSKDVIIPEGVTKLGPKLFYEIELDSLQLPSTLEEIGYEALEDTNLTELVVPDSVTKIEYDAFYDIDKVIYNGPAICEGSKLWGADELYGTKDENFAYTNNGKYIVNYIGESEDIVVPEGVIGILYGTFKYSTINTIQLPNSLQYIGTEVFEDTDLISLEVPSSVVQIDKDAFLGVGYINYDGPATYDDDNKYWGAKGINAIIENGFVLSKDRATLLGYVGEEVDIVIPDGVLKIEDKAFYNKKLNSVVIPSSVQMIGEQAFADTGLKIIEVPDTVMMIGKDAFNGIEVLIYNGGALSFYSNNWGAKYRNAVIDGDYIYSVDRKTIISYLGTSKDVVIPDGVTAIGAEAFKSKTLNSVTIPSSVTSIGTYAFAYTGLSEINIPDTVTSIGEHAFNNIQILQYNGSASYGSSDKYWGAQYMNASINDLFIISDDGKTLEKYIGSSTKNIIIPDGVEIIADRAFYSTLINTVTIPDSVTTIGEYAFYFYPDETLKVPNSVINIGSHAFKNLHNLIYDGSATYDSNDEYWGALVMNGGYKEGNFLYTDSSKTVIAEYKGYSIEDIVIPEGVIKIKREAFEYDTLNSITLPTSLKSIGEDAFNWSKIRSVLVIPDSVEMIADNAFCKVGAIEYHGTLTSNDNWGARSLNPFVEDSFVYRDNSKKELLAYIGTDKNIIVPDTVENIEKYAFFYINADTIELPNSLINIGYDAFMNSRIPVLVIPSSVTEIQNSAFGFFGGEEIILPNTITKIEDNAIDYSDVKKVNIPSSVTQIGKNIFYHNDKIETVDFEVKEGWKVQKGSETINISSADMNDMSKVIDYMTNKYKDYTWSRE